MDKIIVVVTFILYSNLIYGQNSNENKLSNIKVSEFSVMTGFSGQKDFNFPVSDFKLLAPESEILKMDFSGFSKYSYEEYYQNPIFSMMIGLKFRNKDHSGFKPNQTVRFGISYSDIFSFEEYFQKVDNRRIDTLVSGVNGEVYYVDSVTSQNQSMGYYSDQLRIEGSIIFSTNQESRWCFNAGIGISAGVSLYASTEIYYSENKNTVINYSEYYHSYPYWSGGGTYISETFRNKNNYGFSAFVPMGVDFRIGKKKEFWKHAHLFFEFRPGVNILIIPETESISSTNSQQLFGFKYVIN